MKYSYVYMAHLVLNTFLRLNDSFFKRIIICCDMRGKNLLKMARSPQTYNYFKRVLIMMNTKLCLLTSLHNWEELLFLVLDHKKIRAIVGLENKHEVISQTDLIIPFLLFISSMRPQSYTLSQNNKIVFNDITWKI